MRIIQFSGRKKQALLAVILVAAIALTHFATKAWAMGGKPPGAHAVAAAQPSTNQRRFTPEDFISSTTTSTTTTTTTTTTTVPPTRRKVQETPEVAPVSIEPLEGDWVAQCKVWAEMAGIDLPASAITLLDRESDCNPTVRNPNSSAGGIAQALPWTKMGCPLEYSDEAAVCQLKWMHGYVMGRYSSWDQALAHSHRVGWY